ncbi:MAG TPA: radical SAM protein [Bacteroidales bacterium]|jgi:DNA repair photolyase|nr:radical SAM protein [Bacteroidales bacterium]
MIDYIEAKSILSPLKGGPDPYFGIKYNMNLYRGCQHQCIYCDTRSKVYRIGDLSHIRIKKNAIELLEKKLKSLRNKGTIGTGSMNDPYMPIEKKEKLTHNALKIIRKYNYPVHIITKSNLVLRDLDILADISKTYVAVSFTITAISDSISKQIEPFAPVTSERLLVMRALSEQGIYTGAVLTPVLPFITDTKENIAGIVDAVANVGGNYIISWMGMTQREGHREYYYHKLDEKFPGIKAKYQKYFGDSYNCNSPNADKLYKVLNEKCQLNNLSQRMKFWKPDTPMQLDLF